MTQAIKGKDKALMFRLLAERDTKQAQRLALQINHTIKKESKSETVMTKDGPVVTTGGTENSIELEALASDTDTNAYLEHSVDEGLTLEVWEIDFSKPKTDSDGKVIPNKYWAKYGTGALTGWESPAEVESNTTIKSTMLINDKLVGGWATVTEEDELAAKTFFYDTVAAAEQVDPIPLYQPNKAVAENTDTP